MLCVGLCVALRSTTLATENLLADEQQRAAMSTVFLHFGLCTVRFSIIQCDCDYFVFAILWMNTEKTEDIVVVVVDVDVVVVVVMMTKNEQQRNDTQQQQQQHQQMKRFFA